MDRRLSFLALLIGAETFNLFYSFVAGLLTLGGPYGFGTSATQRHELDSTSRRDGSSLSAVLVEPADDVLVHFELVRRYAVGVAIEHDELEPAPQHLEL